jgi:hypothetical protein
MSRKKPKVLAGAVLYDVFYDDGTRASNRKVPRAELVGPDTDAAAMTFIIGQDRRFADLSGKAPRLIKRLARSS